MAMVHRLVTEQTNGPKLQDMCVGIYKLWKNLEEMPDPVSEKSDVFWRE